MSKARGRPDVAAVLAGCSKDLARAYFAIGDYEKAEPLAREVLAEERASFGPEDARLSLTWILLGTDLLKQRKWAEAEAVFRDFLAVHMETRPGHLDTIGVRSRLGESLIGQGRFGEAEPLVVGSYERMKAVESAMPRQFAVALSEAALRVVRLYESWGKPDLANSWKARLGLADLPADVFVTP